MYLKSIISTGFKSFADRVVINLDRSEVTGIVGPNGSGKSNVIDAVRWVMGEQNAKMLRGEKATDIIFAGSERRQAVSMAEVTLVFDNKEASAFCPPEYRHEPEIALTRRIYRDGQREFFINKQPCRLKDIIRFFAASGLGGRSYSMIQQGQVDRILQAKPEELREIIEEASGILIFKKRKQDAAKKFASTQTNLDRIDDILKERSERKDTLKGQVEKATKHQETQTELRIKEIELALSKEQSIQKDREKLLATVTEKEQQQQELTQAIKQDEGDVTQLQVVLEKADPEIHKLSEEMANKRETIARIETNLQNLMELERTGDQQVLHLQEELKAEAEYLASVIEQAQKHGASHTQLNERKQAADDKLETLEDRLDELNDNVRQFQSALEKHKQKKLDLDKQLDRQEIQELSLLKNSEHLINEKKLTQQKVAKLEEELSHAAILLDSSQIQFAKHQRDLNQKKLDKTGLEDQTSELNKRLKQKLDRVSVVRSKVVEYESLISTLKNISDLEQDLSKLLDSLKEKYSGEIYLLTDELNYQSTATELPPKAKDAFEKWTERYVVPEDVDVAGLQEYFQDYKGSPVHFSIATPQKNFELGAFSEQLIQAQDVVSFEKDSIGSILSNCFFLKENTPKEEVSDILQHLKSFEQPFLLIEADGHIYGPKELTFGCEYLQGALTRKQKLGEFTEQLSHQNDSLELLTQQKDKIENQLNSKSKLLKDLCDDIDHQQNELLTSLGKLKNQETELSRKQSLSKDLRHDLGQLTQRTAGFEEQLSEIQEKTTAVQTQLDDMKFELEQAEADHLQATEEKSETDLQVQQIKLDLAGIVAQLENFQQSQDFNDDQVEILQKKIELKEKELQKLQDQIVEAGEKKGQLEKDVFSLIQSKEQLQEIYNQKKEKNDDLITAIKQAEDKLRRKRLELEKLIKELGTKELELDRVENHLSTIKQRLEEMEITQEEQLYDIKGVNANYHQKQIAKLKNQLEQIGPVNMLAIDEYNEINEGIEFMAAQKTEVVASLDLLQLAIDEIEETSKHRLLETFHLLNKEFSVLFPILFPRGRGELILEDPEDPLNTGVEIMVKLPGKNQQSMRLFSGGEKALTAIALILGLLKTKPTPFCFLDEVDAALDEKNVSRFNRVLEELSHYFQFIVITHRRGTMEILDTLYGVTMQEPGVSKVVGVDLDKTLPIHLKKPRKEVTLNS